MSSKRLLDESYFSSSSDCSPTSSQNGSSDNSSDFEKSSERNFSKNFQTKNELEKEEPTTTKTRLLPSVDDLFDSVSNLEFKNFKNDQNIKRGMWHEVRTNLTPTEEDLQTKNTKPENLKIIDAKKLTVSANNEDGNNNNLKLHQVVDHGGRTNIVKQITAFDIINSKPNTTESRLFGGSNTKGKGGKGGPVDIKERTKLKRAKGQSGEDHSGLYSSIRL